MRPTLRLRLTLVYGALFFLAGLVLLGVTYLLFNQQLAQTFEERYGAPTEPGRHRQIIIAKEGATLTGDAAIDWLWREQQGLRDAAVTSLLTQGTVALVLVGGGAVGLGWVVAGRVLADRKSVV